MIPKVVQVVPTEEFTVYVIHCMH